MSLCKLTILPDNKTIRVPKGSVLLKAISDAGINIDSSCGGQGVCGRCRVIVEAGDYNPEPTTHLTDKEVEQGYCLACVTLIEGDMKISIPPSVQLGKEKILAGVEGEAGYRLTVGHWEINPRTKKIHLKLPPPTLDDNLSDLERLYRELRRKGYAKAHIHCGLEVLRRLGGVLREKNWELTLTLVEQDSLLYIMDIEPGDVTRHRYGLAIDIGTTTVVVHLVDLIDGRVVEVASSYNSQVACGEDVISRIIYAQKGGLSELHQRIISTINKLIDQLAEKSGILPERLESIVAAGNTTMTHLLLGIDPSNIRRDPYIPSASFFPLTRTAQLGIKANRQALLYCMPCVASYVGGDITAGVLRSEIYKMPGLSLFIDIGTNGEIVLGNSDWLMAASCSAGPAFEGGGVKCGMRAMPGAIEQIRIDRKTCEPEFIKVIGGGKPSGICGSGIIDALAGMFLAGVVDRNGKINRELKSPRIRISGGVAEYVLVWADGTQTNADIVLTEVDIDNVMRAKGAMYAGFRLLLKETGHDFSQLDSFLIAGGLGNYLNIESAIVIGLLPDIPYDKFKYLGNSSVIGAHLALLSSKLQQEGERIAHSMTNMELSVSPGFMEEYMSALFLPHTDLDAFPTVAQLIGKDPI
jgi:uncharacterized 2Fe-2S/4Fe-4S cluster protein (DUF4445 family)